MSVSKPPRSPSLSRVTAHRAIGASSPWCPRWLGRPGGKPAIVSTSLGRRCGAAANPAPPRASTPSSLRPDRSPARHQDVVLGVGPLHLKAGLAGDRRV